MNFSWKQTHYEKRHIPCIEFVLEYSFPNPKMLPENELDFWEERATSSLQKPYNKIGCLERIQIECKIGFSQALLDENIGEELSNERMINYLYSLM